VVSGTQVLPRILDRPESLVSFVCRAIVWCARCLPNEDGVEVKPSALSKYTYSRRRGYGYSEPWFVKRFKLFTTSGTSPNFSPPRSLEPGVNRMTGVGRPPAGPWFEVTAAALRGRARQNRTGHFPVVQVAITNPHLHLKSKAARPTTNQSSRFSMAHR
jgi:hypothetical protein